MSKGVKAARPLALALLLALVPAPACAAVDLDALAHQAAAGARSPTETVAALVRWTHDHLSWTSTDYQIRMVDEILAGGGGNCREQAVVVRALLDRLGIRTRQIREINIQPASISR